MRAQEQIDQIEQSPEYAQGGSDYQLGLDQVPYEDRGRRDAWALGWLRAYRAAERALQAAAGEAEDQVDQLEDELSGLADQSQAPVVSSELRAARLQQAQAERALAQLQARYDQRGR